MKQLTIMTNTGAFGLPWLVAEREGLFQPEGLQVVLLPRDPVALEPAVFDRSKERGMERAATDLYSVCEWGALQRIAAGSRGRIFYVISTASPFAILACDQRLRSPRDLDGVSIGIKRLSGSHYATLALLESHLPAAAIRPQHLGGPLQRLRQLLAGAIPAVTLMEHYIQLAEFHGAHRIVWGEFAEVAFVRGDLDQQTGECLLGTVRQAVACINGNWLRYRDLLLADVPPPLTEGFTPAALRYFEPAPYTTERFFQTQAWLLRHGFLIAPLAFDQVVMPKGGGIDGPSTDS